MPASPSAPSSDSALRLAVDIRRVPGMRRLAIDYSFDYARLADFYAGDPSQPASWSAAIHAATDRRFDRQAIADIIAGQQARRDAPAEARAAAHSLADPRAVAIVTGQQAGLFGGPLYTLLKAVTAIRLAERVRREHDVPVVPVFWIDAEDHDWNEIASATVWNGEDVPSTVTAAAPEGAGDRPAAALQFTDDIARVVQALGAALPASEFTSALIESLGADYAPGRSVPDAFGRWLERTLGAFGLVVFDSADPAAKPLVADLFRAELDHPGRTAKLAADAGAALAERGYHSQVEPADGSVCLFLLNPARHPIKTTAEGFSAGEQGFTRAALVERAASSPESFSPNVLLRPLVQDTLFPTICYVAGPNELAYLGQLKQVYARAGLPMPLIQPRATATVVDAAALRFLSRYQVAFEQLAAQDEAALNELLRAQLPPAVERAVQDADAEIAARMDAVIRAVPAIDPTLEGAARSTLGKIAHDMKALRGKIVQAAKRRDETLRRQFTHVQALSFPGGTPQERTIGFVAFLNKYGPAFVERLIAELPLDGGTHWVITV